MGWSPLSEIRECVSTRSDASKLLSSHTTYLRSAYALFSSSNPTSSAMLHSSTISDDNDLASRLTRRDSNKIDVNVSVFSDSATRSLPSPASSDGLLSPLTPEDGAEVPSILAAELKGKDPGVTRGRFKLGPSSIDEDRPFKVVVIGAGYSGIIAGIRCVFFHARFVHS